MGTSWMQYYPRPQLRRESFFCLAGPWTLNGRPITLPWPPQAPLSGWEGAVGDALRYETTFTLPPHFLPAGYRLILHFGAVDQVARVLLNGVEVARHEGGYLPFSADVTAQLRKGENALTVEAEDTLSHRYPYGKQHRRPHGMWYTPVSGIWQSVWLEAVPEAGAVTALRITPDLTGVTLEVEAGGAEFTVTVPLAGRAPLVVKGRGGKVRINVPDPHLWTPEDPFLYPFTVTTAADRVESYFALRTVTMKEIGGYTRLCLNGRPIFLHGVLDQGYFHDGLFLPAAPAEYERDVLRMKALGFNALRKHIKSEPEAFYYACDRLGMLVLQDMVNSGGYSWLFDTVIPNFVCKRRPDRLPGSAPRRRFFEAHTLATIAHLHNHPCVVGWTLFNEGWGQYDSDRIYRLCKAADPTRFIVSTSGWFAQRESDAESEHIYFRTRVLEARRPGQFLLLSECGGFTRRVEGHMAQGKQDYGYGAADTEEALTGRIQALYRDMVLPSIPKGLCGCIYTQLSDIEGEINGLYTYDRQVRKIPADAMNTLAARLAQAMAQAAPPVPSPQ